jgi:hypothetical protein
MFRSTHFTDSVGMYPSLTNKLTETALIFDLEDSLSDNVDQNWRRAEGASIDFEESFLGLSPVPMKELVQDGCSEGYDLLTSSTLKPRQQVYEPNLESDSPTSMFITLFRNSEEDQDVIQKSRRRDKSQICLTNAEEALLIEYAQFNTLFQNSEQQKASVFERFLRDLSEKRPQDLGKEQLIKKVMKHLLEIASAAERKTMDGFHPSLSSKKLREGDPMREKTYNHNFFFLLSQNMAVQAVYKNLVGSLLANYDEFFRREYKKFKKVVMRLYRLAHDKPVQFSQYLKYASGSKRNRVVFPWSVETHQRACRAVIGELNRHDGACGRCSRRRLKEDSGQHPVSVPILDHVEFLLQ